MNTRNKKIKKALHKIRVFIIEFITMTALILCFISVCCLDSESYIPAIIFILSIMWLMVFAWANNMLYTTKKEFKK